MGKVSARTALAGADTAADDVYPVVDTSAGASGSKKQTAAELLQAVAKMLDAATALSGSGVHATQDKVFISDNGVAKSILVTELGAALIALGAAITSGFSNTEDHILYSDNGVLKKVTPSNLALALFSLVTSGMLGSDGATSDTIMVNDGGTVKTMTLEELTSWVALQGFPLGDVPEYADQAAAQAGLSGTGRLWRQATTGLLGVTIA